LAAVLGRRRSAGGGAAAHAMTPMHGRAWVGGGLVVAATTFNMVLCFINTHALAISATHVMASEIIIIGLAAILSYRVITPHSCILVILFSAYFCTIWLVTGTVNAKVIRDLLIPLVFVLCGAACAKPSDADRLIYVLILAVLAVALVEWFWLDRFLKVFNILGYFVAKGRTDDSQTWMQIDVALNGMRLEAEGRTLFPALGIHRVSSIFLEPVSTGNFAAVAFAWLLIRFKIAPLKNLVFMAVAATVFILADNRFAAVTCLILVIARMMPPLPATLLWLLPFLSVAGVINFADTFPRQEIDQSFQGRLVGSGQLIASFDVDDWFGFSQRLFKWMVDVDSGYAYAIYAVGLPGLILLWTAFCFARDRTVDGARYRTLLALYLSLGFFVSQSAFSIKTAALAWFLLGASQNGIAMMRVARSVAGLPVARPQPYSAGLRP
jgi:putative polymerase